MNVASLTIDQVRDGLAKREFSAVELAKEALRFAEAENPKTNAYISLCPERAIAAAEAVDRKIAAGENAGLLAGVPVAAEMVFTASAARSRVGARTAVGTEAGTCATLASAS